MRTARRVGPFEVPKTDKQQQHSVMQVWDWDCKDLPGFSGEINVCRDWTALGKGKGKPSPLTPTLLRASRSGPSPRSAQLRCTCCRYPHQSSAAPLGLGEEETWEM